ncbi:hypothetical protein [Enterococcus casseliflavus]|uniref:Cell division protein FtsL n=1 Tax=Enterococcus casseliflavus TaxID=37734 RepID=A0ABD5FL38_ENTCA|nr:hypothetical protein [Enterococcus casseliflavus]MDT2982738.1 hypothetical protein [Enterococcus casseliflavus]
MSNKQAIIITVLTVLALSCLSYTIVDQQKQIEQLQEQLQYEQMKYKIIINDPLVRDAMEAGG